MLIVTLGADGALLSDQDGEPVTYQSFKVEVVDTTAAGALAVTKFGTQASLPTRAAVENILKTGILR